MSLGVMLYVGKLNYNKKKIANTSAHPIKWIYTFLDATFHLPNYQFNNTNYTFGSAWVAQSVKHLTLDFWLR